MRSPEGGPVPVRVLQSVVAAAAARGLAGLGPGLINGAQEPHEERVYWAGPRSLNHLPPSSAALTRRKALPNLITLSQPGKSQPHSVCARASECVRDSACVCVGVCHCACESTFCECETLGWTGLSDEAVLRAEVRMKGWMCDPVLRWGASRVLFQL